MTIMKKRIMSCAAAVAVLSLIASSSPELAGGQEIGAYAEGVQYTYEITPIISNFNEFFFVKTDDPDPSSFRFADKSSKYSEDSYISAYSTEFADVDYEDSSTLRTGGGYIFSSYSTDGGEVVLQKKENYTWTDTDVTVTLPVLVDDVDYLIDTYATKDSFFDNMSAVQSGFSSICLYSGSSIRGELYRNENLKWRLANSPHADQKLYINSPYSRRNGKRLLASAIYPYRYDSLGFPSVMGTVSKRLDSSSSYTWDSYNHYLINVTYNGETKSYGGAGSGEGKEISESDIIKRYDLSDSSDEITLDSTLSLLREYSKIEVPDDIPREDALTWESVYNTVGSGAWVKTANAYAYLYQNDDRNYHYAEEFGTGHSIYWSGSLGMASDTWVDGRYLSVHEAFVKGEKFEDHSTSSIIFTNMKLPQVTFTYSYTYNYSAGKYEKKYSDVSVSERTVNARFVYNSTEGCHVADSSTIGSGSYDDLKALAEQGLISADIPAKFRLTAEDAKALGVDAKTDIDPEYGYSYNGKDDPGTPFGTAILYGDTDVSGEVDMRDLALLQQHLANWNVEIDLEAADVNADGTVEMQDLALLQQYLAGWQVRLGK